MNLCACKKFFYVEKKKRENDIFFINKKNITQKEKEIIDKYDDLYLKELLFIEKKIEDKKNNL